MLTVKTEDYRPGAYLSFVLAPQTRATILRHLPPAYPIVHCDHVTVCFRFDEEKYKQMIAFFMAAKAGWLEAVGYSDFDGLEALSVRAFGAEKRHFDDSFYHITLSHDTNHKPKDSKTKLDSIAGIPDMAFEPVMPLSGEIMLVNM